MVNFPNFSHTKKFLSYSRNFFPILISFVMVAVSAGAYIYVWQNYRFQATEERLQQQIASLEIQLQQERVLNANSQNTVMAGGEKKSNEDISGRDKTDYDNRINYSNNEIGVELNMPYNWSQNSQKSTGTGYLEEVFLYDDLSTWRSVITAVNHDRCGENCIKDHWYFATKYLSIDDFCKNGCEKINENVAIDYRSNNAGDRGFDAMLYTNLSSDYPSFCFTLNLNDALDEASKKKGVGYYDISDSDVKSMIKNRELSDDVLQKVDAFVKMASTIKKIE